MTVSLIIMISNSVDPTADESVRAESKEAGPRKVSFLES